MRTKSIANYNRLSKTDSRSFFSFALILALPLCFIACPGEEKRSAPAVRAADSAPVSNTEASAAASPANVTIDADSAFKHVEKQVAFGPRPAGSAQLAKTREYLLNELRTYGLNVTTDQFTASTPAGEKQMANVVAELPGQTQDIIIISSHYDTKPFDKFKFVGANDGASSTAVLLELARVLAASKEKAKATYRFVFFDGEEAFCEQWEQCGKPDSPDNTYGSRHYARQLVERNEAGRVRAMILLDMIGYKKLEIGRDDDMSTKWLVDTIWDTARELGYSQQFQNRTEGVGGDDHEPFLRAGIESVDLIQLGSYPYWHTPEDTLDKISPQSLKIVGDVVLASLPKIEGRKK